MPLIIIIINDKIIRSIRITGVVIGVISVIIVSIIRQRQWRNEAGEIKEKEREKKKRSAFIKAAVP